MNQLILIFFIIFIFFNSAQAKTDNCPNDFSGLGRYIETFEINDSDEDIIKRNDNDSFDGDVFIDATKQIENNIIELKLDDIDSNALQSVNKERLFKIHVNEDKYNIENSIKNENMIWDSSKTFLQSYFNNSSYRSPIPSVVNSSKISTVINPALSASIGQTYLYDANGTNALFIKTNESKYNTGAVVSYKGDALNLSVGSFLSSFNNVASGGAIFSTDSIKLPYNSGSLIFGGGLFSKEEQKYDTTSGGGFIQYSINRFKLSAQVGQNRYSNSSNYDTSLYLVPEIKFSESLYLKTRFTKNITNDIVQNEIGIIYKPKKNNNNIEFEINTSNKYSQKENLGRKINFSTSFKI